MKELQQSRDNEQAQRELEQRELAWRLLVSEPGNHGSLGARPPMLEVEDGGAVVSVTNTGDMPLSCVEVRRLPQPFDGVER